jgi:hypothetical protein
MHRPIWHPTEIVKSLGELVLRAALSLWAILTVLVAGVAAVLERVSPGTHVSDRLWFKIAIGGAVVSVAWAYHRMRLERDAAHAGDVRGDHLGELQRRLEVLRTCVERDEPGEYEDAPGGRRTHYNAFKAHYPELGVSLDDWDAAVRRVAAAQRTLRDMLKDAIADADEASPWHGISEPDYSVQNVVEVLYRIVVQSAEKGELGDNRSLRPWDFRNPLPTAFDAPPTQAPWAVLLGQSRIAIVPDLPEDGRDDRLQAVRQRVEALWQAAERWDVAAEVGVSKEALTGLKQPLMDDIQEWRKVSGIRVARDCSICRKNEGWPEPQPSLWRRGWDQIGRGR